MIFGIYCATTTPRELRHCIVGTESTRVAEIDCTFCNDCNCFWPIGRRHSERSVRIYFVVSGNQRMHIVVQRELRSETMIENNNHRLCTAIEVKIEFTILQGKSAKGTSIAMRCRRGNYYLKLINNLNAKQIAALDIKDILPNPFISFYQFKCF